MVQFSKNDPKKKGKLPRSMQPVIPEPIHRIPPKGVTEGMSFRNLPGPSLTEIRNICKHYESKCSGDYRSLAYRYVLEMSKEIQGQIDGIETEGNRERHRRAPCVGVPRNGLVGGIGGRMKRERLSEDMNADNWMAEMNHRTSRWNDSGDSSISRRRNYFDFSEVDSRWNDGQDPTSAQERFYPDLTQIKKELVEKCDELRQMKENMDSEMERCKKEYEDRLEVERLLLKKTRDDLTRKYQKEIRNLKQENSQVKKDAKVVIDFVRRKANEALAEEVEKCKYEKKQLTRELNKAESKLKRGFNQRLQSIGEDIKTVLRQKKYPGEKNSSLPVPPPPSLDIRCPPNSSIDSTGNSEGSISQSRSKVNAGSDDSIPALGSDGDSISTKEDGLDINFLDTKNWFEKRIKELDQWTDTLTGTVQKGIKIKGSASPSRRRNRGIGKPPSPPPIKRIAERSLSPPHRRNHGIGKPPSPPPIKRSVSPARHHNHGIGKQSTSSPPPMKRIVARVNEDGNGSPRIIW